jgi:diketogulonate reductase-like aldo/keto reductase
MVQREFTLNTGATILAIGLGTWQSTDTVGIQGIRPGHRMKSRDSHLTGYFSR